MAKIVPSQVVAIIDRMFPWAANEGEWNDSSNRLTKGNSVQLAAVVALVEQIPAELLSIEAQLYSELVCAVAAVKDCLNSWQSQDSSLAYIPGLPRISPVTLIRRALLKCPDEPVETDSTALVFIKDEALRLNLLSDISAMNRALSNGEWKAATVLAGSVLEALLLWRLKLADTGEVRRGADRLFDDITLSKKPHEDLNHWHLSEYLELAASIGVIGETAAVQARLAKDFRNLIHPGREARLKQVSNRGTALSAVAAVEHVIEHFMKNL